MRRVVAAHETGHQFSLAHSGLLMGPTTPQLFTAFDQVFFEKIRSAPFPTCQP